jgi:hypothetical protein
MVSAAVSGLVYFITTEHAERVKIGHTKNDPTARLRELQTGSPFRLCIIATERGDVTLERRLHARFGQHRLHGEWFTLCGEIKEHIKELNRSAFREADRAQRMPPKWVRIFNAFENGATPEEADVA